VNVMIMAGGLGTRLQEETVARPKPMLEIGGRPILWHIMKIYATYGYKEFAIALGYKGDVIKSYFINYHALTNDLTIELGNGHFDIHPRACEDWTVHLIDTGLETQTGGRIKRVAERMGRQPFLMTYGDGVADINIHELVAFHRQHGKLATITAVRPPARFGGLTFNGDRVERFTEKPQIGEGWINGGFFVLEPGVVDYIEGDESIFESEPLERLAAEGELVAYRHASFWQCMDTARDLRLLENLWQNNRPPWKIW